MISPLDYAAMLRQLADEAEPRQFTVTLGVTEVRAIARHLEELDHLVRLYRTLFYDAQNLVVECLQNPGRSPTHDRQRA